MKAFLDTTVLVATFYGDHEHHARSHGLFADLKKQTGSTAGHCLTEAYAVMTGMPGKNRASPDEALLFLREVFDRLTVLTLNAHEYLQALENSATLGVSGGTIYDAIIGRCALKAKAQTIYTWNKRHFSALGPDVATRVREP